MKILLLLSRKITINGGGCPNQGGQNAYFLLYHGDAQNHLFNQN